MGFPHAADRMTEEEFLSMPETMERIELIDGEVIVAPSPTVAHQETLVELVALCREWKRAHPPAFLGMAPLDLRIAKGRIVQPDLFIFVDGLPPTDPIVTGIPDLVLEVLSQKKSYDRLMKRALYTDAGVAEYWMVDIDERRIDIVTPDGLTSHADTAESRVAPGLRIALADVLR